MQRFRTAETTTDFAENTDKQVCRRRWWLSYKEHRRGRRKERRVAAPKTPGIWNKTLQCSAPTPLEVKPFCHLRRQSGRAPHARQNPAYDATAVKKLPGTSQAPKRLNPSSPYDPSAAIRPTFTTALCSTGQNPCNASFAECTLRKKSATRTCSSITISQQDRRQSQTLVCRLPQESRGQQRPKKLALNS